MFHVERLVHAAGNFDTQVLVDSIFWNFHFVPFGELHDGNTQTPRIKYIYTRRYVDNDNGNKRGRKIIMTTMVSLYLGRQRSRTQNDSAQLFIFEREHALRFGEEFHFDEWQRVSGSEIALSVPPEMKKKRIRFDESIDSSVGSASRRRGHTLTLVSKLPLGPSAISRRPRLPWCSRRCDWVPTTLIP